MRTLLSLSTAGALVALSLSACVGGDPSNAPGEEPLGDAQEAYTCGTVALSPPDHMIQFVGGSYNNLYWSHNDYQASPQPNNATIYTASKTSTGSETDLYHEYDADNPGYHYWFGGLTYASVAGSAYIYFVANYENLTTHAQTSYIKRIPQNGGAAQIMVTAPRFIGDKDLITDGTNLYFGDTIGVSKVPLTGGTVSYLATGSANHLALDGTQLYFEDVNIIHHISTSGGTVATAATAATAVTALFVTHPSYAVVWWGEASGAVRNKIQSPLFGVSTFQAPIPPNPTGDQAAANSVAVQGSNLVWTECTPVYAGNPNTSCDLRWHDATTSAGAPTILSTCPLVLSNAGNIQLDATGIFYGDAHVDKYLY